MGRFQTTYPRPLRSNYAKYIARHGMEKWLWGIIKYGFLDVPGLLTQLENRPVIKHRGSVSGVIARCVQAKADIVEQDERELVCVPS